MFVDDTSVSTIQSYLDVFWTGWRIPVHPYPACIASRFGTVLERDLGRKDGESLVFVQFKMLVGFGQFFKKGRKRMIAVVQYCFFFLV